MSCLMNFRPEQLPDFQSPLIEARARVEREQIAALHERCAGGWCCQAVLQGSLAWGCAMWMLDKVPGRVCLRCCIWTSSVSPPPAIPAGRLFSSTSGELRALQLADSLEDTLWAACMVNSRCFSETVSWQLACTLEAGNVEMQQHCVLSPPTQWLLPLAQPPFVLFLQPFSPPLNARTPPPAQPCQVAGETVSLMVPCADMANHVLVPNAGYRFVPEADAFQLQALQVKGAVRGCRLAVAVGNHVAAERSTAFVGACRTAAIVLPCVGPATPQVCLPVCLAGHHCGRGGLHQLRLHPQGQPGAAA